MFIWTSPGQNQGSGKTSGLPTIVVNAALTAGIAIFKPIFETISHSYSSKDSVVYSPPRLLLNTISLSAPILPASTTTKDIWQIVPRSQFNIGALCGIATCAIIIVIAASFLVTPNSCHRDRPVSNSSSSTRSRSARHPTVRGRQPTPQRSSRSGGGGGPSRPNRNTTGTTGGSRPKVHFKDSHLLSVAERDSPPPPPPPSSSPPADAADDPINKALDLSYLFLTLLICGFVLARLGEILFLRPLRKSNAIPESVAQEDQPAVAAAPARNATQLQGQPTCANVIPLTAAAPLPTRSRVLHETVTIIVTQLVTYTQEVFVEYTPEAAFKAASTQDTLRASSWIPTIFSLGFLLYPLSLVWHMRHRFKRIGLMSLVQDITLDHRDDQFHGEADILANKTIAGRADVAVQTDKPKRPPWRPPVKTPVQMTSTLPLVEATQISRPIHEESADIGTASNAEVTPRPAIFANYSAASAFRLGAIQAFESSLQEHELAQRSRDIQAAFSTLDVAGTSEARIVQESAALDESFSLAQVWMQQVLMQPGASNDGQLSSKTAGSTSSVPETPALTDGVQLFFEDAKYPASSETLCEPLQSRLRISDTNAEASDSNSQRADDAWTTTPPSTMEIHVPDSAPSPSSSSSALVTQLDSNLRTQWMPSQYGAIKSASESERAELRADETPMCADLSRAEELSVMVSGTANLLDAPGPSGKPADVKGKSRMIDDSDCDTGISGSIRADVSTEDGLRQERRRVPEDAWTTTPPSTTEIYFPDSTSSPSSSSSALATQLDSNLHTQWMPTLYGALKSASQRTKLRADEMPIRPDLSRAEELSAMVPGTAHLCVVPGQSGNPADVKGKSRMIDDCDIGISGSIWADVSTEDGLQQERRREPEQDNEADTISNPESDKPVLTKSATKRANREARKIRKGGTKTKKSESATNMQTSDLVGLDSEGNFRYPGYVPPEEMSTPRPRPLQDLSVGTPVSAPISAGCLDLEAPPSNPDNYARADGSSRSAYAVFAHLDLTSRTETVGPSRRRTKRLNITQSLNDIELGD